MSLLLCMALASRLAGVLLSGCLFFLSLAYFGRSLLKQSNAEWERPPDHGAARRTGKIGKRVHAETCI